jgi:hypothetical protein
LLWGDPEHIGRVFGNRVSSLEITPGTYTERIPGGPRGYCQYYKETFGPVAAIYAELAANEAAALDHDFLSFATKNNTGPPGRPSRIGLPVHPGHRPHLQPLTAARSGQVHQLN